MGAKYGFTLVELLVVVLLVGIIFSFSIPMAYKIIYSPERELKQVAVKIWTALQTAKWYAGINNVDSGVFYPSDNSYCMMRKMTEQEFSDNIGNPTDPNFYWLYSSAYVKLPHPHEFSEIQSLQFKTHMENIYKDSGVIEVHVWDSEKCVWGDYTSDMEDNSGRCFAHVFTPRGRMLGDEIKARGEIHIEFIEPDEKDYPMAIIEVFLTTGRLVID